VEGKGGRGREEKKEKRVSSLQQNRFLVLRMPFNLHSSNE
jgi:hypothetical protein